MGILDRTATLRPGEDPGNTSTSGLGSLISVSDLYKNALQGNNQNVGGTVNQLGINPQGRDDYRSRITTAPGGIGTLQLGPQAYIDPRDQRYVHDAYQYFLNQQGGGTGGGQDAATMPPITPSVTSATTGDGGITAASAAQNMGGGVNTPFEQNLIDQGAGVQIAPGQPVVAPGEMPVTQAEMDAFNQIPVNREYGDPMDIGYGEGQVDPNLAAAVGGKDTTPLGGANLVTTSSGDVFATDDPMLQEKMDYTEQDPAWWESARDKFVQTGQDVGGFFGDLKDKGIDVGRMAGSAIMNMVQPGLGLLAKAIPFLSK